MDCLWQSHRICQTSLSIWMWSSRHTSPDLPKKREMSTLSFHHCLLLSDLGALCHIRFHCSSYLTYLACLTGKEKKREKEKTRKTQNPMLPKDKGHFKNTCTYWNKSKSKKGKGGQEEGQTHTHTAFRNLTMHLDYSILHKMFTHFFRAVTLHTWLAL